jgi:two-component system NarL family sensor kinase
MNDTMFETYLSFSALLLVFAAFLIAYIIVNRQRQNHFELEKEKMDMVYRNGLLTATIQEQERVINRLSTELHDNMGQSLSFLKMSLSVLSRQLSDTADRSMIEHMQLMMERLINDVHYISHVLNSTYIKRQGLAELLQIELDRLAAGKEIITNLEIKGTITIGNSEKELLIYRIAQEAIHNIAKHAGATDVRIQLIMEDDFSMRITDNGTGFDKGNMKQNGIGLQNMKDRTEMLSGKLNINSDKEKGTDVHLQVPDINTSADIA